MEDKKTENLEATSSLTNEDFTFVQDNDRLHDQKFETKPTTFFKDALKRFVKSRSSVVAASILLVLIGMSIIVPFADSNDINSPLGQASYLPPKWFDGDLGGFLDGTDRVDNAILDPSTLKLPEDSDYKEFAIVGDITTRSSYSDAYSNAVAKYGKGGYLTITNSGNKEEGIFTAVDEGIRSAEITLDLSASYSYKVNFSLEQSVVREGTSLSTYLAFSSTLDEENGEVLIPLTPVTAWEGEGIESLEVSDVSATLTSYMEENSIAVPSSLNGRFAVMVSAPEDEASSANSLAIGSIESNVVTSGVGVAFSTGLEARKAIASQSKSAYSGFPSSSLPTIGLKHAEVVYGSFRYDFYAAAFGDVEYEFTEIDIQNYIERGWLEYEWGTGSQPSSWRLTESGETYCPLRSVQYQTIVENPFEPDLNTRSVHGTRSLYRQLYFEGKIGSCTAPKYIFGTDRNGKDFFKVVFSGLLTSLGLGVLASAINIVIGLIWGAISGYFGGWVDMIMERLTEILGGVPFIIVMTLVALLWNNNGGGTTFWTFLFALCLTGWIGISGTTRSQFYRYKGREYVLASRTLGASDARLIFKHILPNAVGTIVTSAVLMIPSVIFTEANISYLLPGALALKNSFGVTIESVQSDISKAPYLIVSASLIMALLMISFNLFGNGLRDAFNPSLKGSDD